MREINVGTTVDARAVKRAIETAESDSDGAAPVMAAPNDVFLEYYTEKSFLVRGNTLYKKDELKELKGGSWISPKTGGKAWCFSNKRLADVARILNIPPVLRGSPT
jgi:hypothetical protein